MTRPLMAYDTVFPPSPVLRNDPAGAAAIRNVANAARRLAVDGPQAGSSATPGRPAAEHKAEDGALADPSEAKRILFVCDLCEKGKLAPADLIQFVRIILGASNLTAEDKLVPAHGLKPVGDIAKPTPLQRAAMDARPNSFQGRFPAASRIGTGYDKSWVA